MCVTHSHFSRAGGQGVHVHPISFNALTICLTGPGEIIERERALACLAMHLDMAFWYSDGYVNAAEIDVNVST